MSQPTKPTTRLEAIIWNRYNYNRSWDWIPISKWPTDLSKAVITRTLNYVTRFRLFVYFVGNGMRPETARDVMKGMVNSRSAEAHIDGLYRDLERNKNRWTYWDENLRRIRRLAETEVWSAAVRPPRPVAVVNIPRNNRPVIRLHNSVYSIKPRRIRMHRRSKQDKLFDSDYNSDEDSDYD